MKKLFLYIIIAFLLPSCSSATRNKEDIRQTDTTDTAPAMVPATPSAWDHLTIVDLPVVDSTDFDNFKHTNKIADTAVRTLNLHTLHEAATEFYERYRLVLSDHFQSVVITTVAELEMKTFLVNMNDENEIIDMLQIAYDEVAESAFRSVGTIDKTGIVIDHYNYMQEEPEHHADRYVLSASGHFHKTE